MSIDRRSRKSRAAQLSLIVLGLTLFACQFPAILMNANRKPGGTPSSITSSPSAYFGEEVPIFTPTVLSGDGYPIVTVASDQTAYPEIPPIFEYPEPTLSSEYPGAVETSTDLETPYPGGVVEPSSTASLPATSPPATIISIGGYPEPIVPAEETTYPGAEIYPTYPNPYPEGGEPATQAPSDPYPGEGVSPAYPMPTVTPSQAPSGIPELTETPTTDLPPQQSPTFTTTLSRTPFMTPTPTQTPTPTPTRTPLPAPPWVSSKLKATDPKEVKLAAKKPQLVMFFAFWSGPSLAMAPIIQRVEDEYRGRVNFIYLDIDDPDIGAFKRQLYFKVEPHFFLLDGQGKTLRQWIGYTTAASLSSAINEALE